MIIYTYACVYIYREREKERYTEEDEGLAGLRLTRIGGGRGNRTRSSGKVRKKLMSFWHKMVFPVRRVWFSVATRVKAHRKNGPGLLKLHDDIQTCGYEDVQVMWEMLRRTESELLSRPPKRKMRPFWKIFVWDNHSNKSSFSINHA